MEQDHNYNVNEETSVKKSAKIGTIAAIVLGVILIAAVIEIVFVNKNYNRQKDVNTSLSFENQRLNGNLATRDSLMSDMMSTFDQIETDLNMVKQKQNIVSVQSNNPEFQQDKRQAILKDIQLMNSLLESSKSKIASLSQKLKASGIKIAGLEEKINSLTAMIEARDADIIALKNSLADKDFQMAELNKNLDSLQVVQAKSVNTIKEQDYEITKAYYVAGTYKDLKNKGVIIKEGKVFKKKSFQEEVDNKNFTQININEVKTIPVHAKKVEMITEHPKSSYKYVPGENGEIAYVEIENPKEFWKISKYAVLQVK